MKLILTLLFFGSFSCFAQRISAFFTKDSILLGEQTELIFSLKNVSDSFQFDPLQGEIPCEIRFQGEQLWKQNGSVEIRAFSDTTLMQKGIKTWVGTYLLTVWDTGFYQLPIIQLTNEDSTYTTKPPVLHVGFLKKKVDTSLIEVDVQYTKESWWWFKKYWWVIGLLLLAIGGLIWWNFRKRIQPVDTRSLKQRTLAEIAFLRNKKLWESEGDAAHYLAFSQLLRRFLSQCLALQLMERTSQETLLLLRAKGLDPDVLQTIRALLQESDLIKFGKKTTTVDSILQDCNRLQELVVLLSPLDSIE